jgi:oligopeptide transport system ATP-binding protein
MLLVSNLKEVPMNKTDPLLKVENLHVHFPVKKGILIKKTVAVIKAVDGVSFSLNAGETLGLVGESGCGKTTTGRAILKLIEPTSGNIIYKGNNIATYSQKEMMPLRREMQMVFQDPYASLNPRMPIIDIVTDPLIEHHIITNNQKQEKATQLLETVGLDPRYMNRFPHEFSGGQRQRIGIARSLALNPKLLICDEPIAALDVSIQAQVINLLQDLQEQMGLSYLFIAHDLSVVRHISDRIVVMYLGKIMETATKKELFMNPLHPYTKVLLSSVPTADPINERKRKRIELVGEIPSPLNKPKGCSFSTRCPFAKTICHQIEPKTVSITQDHSVACHLYG